MTSSSLVTDYVGRGTHANRPATPNLSAGATGIYYETDTTNTFVWNGSAWTTITASGSSGLYSQVLSTLPTAAGTGFNTWLNQGGASVADSATGICISSPSTGASLKGRTQAVPATPYTRTALIAMTGNYTANIGAGIGWYDGANKVQYIGLNANATPIIVVTHYSNPTTFVANDFVGSANVPPMLWFRLNDDATNVTFSFSMDGANFATVYTVAKASGYLGATGYSNIIFLANPQGAQTYATLMSYA